MPKPRARGPDLLARLRRLVADDVRPAKPPESSRLRVQWLEWLVEEYGPVQVASWQDPPASFEAWVELREHSFPGAARPLDHFT